MERADASVRACSSQKLSWTTILRGGRRNQQQGEIVGAQDLLRQVALVEAGQCPYTFCSFISRFFWTVQVAGTDTPAPAGDFPQNYSSNPKMSPQRVPVAQVSHGWGQKGGSGSRRDGGPGHWELPKNTSGFPCSNGLTAQLHWLLLGLISRSQF